MISYAEHTLSNGLRVIAHRDPTSRMAAINLLYRVGARNENPNRTGFAHLFEHLMFRGTHDIPDFDTPVQMASGDNNAFTNNDYTDYYITLPKDNIETALWLEANRMMGLEISAEKLEAEKKVVIEEYKQRYLNQPYGDQWLLLRALCYKVHPYRWATIGLTPDHVRDATLDEVEAFYHRFYLPGNAILSVACDLDPDTVFRLAEKWFGEIKGSSLSSATFDPEPEQTAARREIVVRDVPATAITIAFPTGARLSRNFYLSDVISDLLAGGSSARLYQHLVKERQLFSAINAYITGDLDPGLFVVTGQLHPEIPTHRGEEAIWQELQDLASTMPTDYELEKVKNKFEAETIFGEINVMNKAMNLGFYDLTGDLPLINREVEIFRSISAQEVSTAAAEMFRPERSNTLIYEIGKA